MQSLRNLQEAFLEGVLQHRPEFIADAIIVNGIEAERRIAIYRNNACEGFAKALLTTYPILTRLAGEDWLRQTITGYQGVVPSTSGNLHCAGQRFAAYLEDLLQDSEHHYFADVARLEWAYQEVLVAAERSPLETAALSSVAAEDYASLCFDLHPASRLIASNYPIFAIWQSNQSGARADDRQSAVHLDAGASRILLMRREDHVEVRELAPAPFALLLALSAGASLGDAADAALTTDPAADFSHVLAQAVALDVFTDFRLSHSNTAAA